MTDEKSKCLAKFKAKYGVSNHMAAALFGVKAEEIKQWAMYGSPKKIDKQVGNVESLIKHIMKEGELLQNQYPLIQVLEHKLGAAAADLAITKKEAEIEKKKTAKINSMGIVNRVIFMLTGSIPNNH